MPENATLSATLNSLSNDFVRKNYQKIDNLNLIPISTIYFGDQWENINDEDLLSQLEPLVYRYKYTLLHVIFIHKNSITHFIAYING